MIKAAIDIGTNSTRLLVVEINNGQSKDLYREARVTRLGQNVDKTGMLSDEAIDRTISVLADYKRIADELKAKEIIVGTTSAARDAKNVDVFIKKVKQETSLDVKILSSTEEATLSFTGAVQHSNQTLDPLASQTAGSPQTLVIDIGGGSTEISAGNIRDNKPSLFFSKDIGSVRLTEMFIKNDPPSQKELEAAASFIEEAYRKPIEKIKSTFANYQIIGTAGTITSLSAINLGLEEYDSNKVHCSILTIAEVEKILNRLKAQTTKEREQIKTMQPGRADVIVMGNLILLKLMQMLEVEKLTVSETDILDGLLQLS